MCTASMYVCMHSTNNQVYCVCAYAYIACVHTQPLTSLPHLRAHRTCHTSHACLCVYLLMPAQALPMLKEKFPIERARMRLQLTCPPDVKEELLAVLAAHEAMIESSEHSDSLAKFTVLVRASCPSCPSLTPSPLP